jgi:galactose mutarotase-like enzyme
VQISNSLLTAGFKLKGAELCSLIHNKTKAEYIWQSDQQWWPRHAPVLFPIVGKLKNNEYKFKGRTFQMGQHGFARDMDFEVLEHLSDSITFLLRINEETLTNYPFQFEFYIEYKLVESRLQTTFLVINNGKQELPFSFGGHPAFNANPIEDYFLTFDKPLPPYFYGLKNGLIASDPLESLNGETLWLSKDTFDKDALIFMGTGQTGITLNHAENGPILTLYTGDFPHLGIWSKPGAPFVCLEPWQGTADWEDTDGQILNKKGIILLKPEENYGAGFSIELI